MKLLSRRNMIAAAALAVGAVAATVALLPRPRDEATIRESLAQRFPDIRVESLSRSAIPGLYEVYYGGRIVYVDERVNYVLQGPLLDAMGKWNLTAERLGKFSAIPFDQLPFDDAIKIVKGTGERKLALFGDPTFPAVRIFDQEFAKVENTTLFVFALPFGHRNPAATETVRGIWCASDRAGAWHEAVANGVKPAAPETCSAPIDKTVQLAAKHGVNVLPTVVFADGRRMTGALSSTHIERLLVAAAAPGAQ